MKVYILEIIDFENLNLDKLVKHVSILKEKKINKFIRKQDKVRCLMGELFLRSMLIKDLGIKNDDINISIDKYHKTYLIDV